jgi:hypothetical protein
MGATSKGRLKGELQVVDHVSEEAILDIPTSEDTRAICPMMSAT